MTSLKQLAMYCRDYIDLVSPSLLSRQAPQVIIPKEILDATPLYVRDDGLDYESLKLALQLEIPVEDIEADEEIVSEDSIQRSNPNEDEVSDSDERDLKLKIAKSLDEIYRKYDTSSYTKQIILKFGRVSFSGILRNDDASEESDKGSGYKRVEEHIFSIPVSITYRDSAGARHYSLSIEDTMINTNTAFLNEYIDQDDKDELFRFISQSESNEETSIPVKASYIDELWAKIIHLLQKKEAKNISIEPDMLNVVVILLPKANYFLSQDLLGIIDAADDESMLETSLSAWTSEKDMSISEEADDNGGQELFFPFPYDNSQLQVLGKLGNKAAVVEGPPGTGKSQTIANILCQLAATGKKVLFVSQKDQAVRGVKDKLKTLDIPYLYGYLPDRSSKLHTEEDEIDSAANSLKGVAQAIYNPSNSPNPIGALKAIGLYKPQFNEALNTERKYFELYSEYLALDSFDFGEDSRRIDKEWYDAIHKCIADIENIQTTLAQLEVQKEKVQSKIDELDVKIIEAKDKSPAMSDRFYSKTNYPWLKNEKELLRNLSYAQVGGLIANLHSEFERSVPDRKSNFLKTSLVNMKLGRELNSSLNALPREMFESIKSIVFEDSSKTERHMKLREMHAYFTAQVTLDERYSKLLSELDGLKKDYKSNSDSITSKQESLKAFSKSLSILRINDESMSRVESLYSQLGDKMFESIQRRLEVRDAITNLNVLNPNFVSEEIKSEKREYKSLIRNYLKNSLSLRVEGFRREKQYRAALESIGRKLSKSKRAYKTFDSLKSNPFNFEAMSGIIPVWMMGLEDASRVLPLAPNLFDYVIIDEASQCNISYALPVMFRSSHTILFGDTLQMRDTTTAFKSNDRLLALANKHKIPEDLQIKANEDSVKSVMDIAKLAGFQTTVLRNHYRSPIELIGFSNDYFYAPKGRRLQVVNDDIVAMDDGRVLKNYIVNPNPEIEISEKTNLTEAYFIKNTLLPQIRNSPQTADKSIAILTFFNEQAELLRRVIPDEDIKISVIEGIQGDERDIVIYSFVIKSQAEKKRYTSLTGEGGEILKEVNEGRVNVAFSRARLQVHAVTSLAPNMWPDGIWIKKYLEYIENNGRVSRLNKSEQHFDSKFEENVYDYLFNKLNPTRYTLTTQVESCGFKIDLVVRDIKTGKKLAIEMDGPTHFEMGDGQVRVASDYERLTVLETAGWRFYHVIYSEWVENESKEKTILLDYIKQYLEEAASVKSETDEITNEPNYVPVNVDIPKDFLDNLKKGIESSGSNKGAFGRKAEAKTQTTLDIDAASKPLQITKPSKETKLKVTTDGVSEEETPDKKQQGFKNISTLELSSKRSLVISLRDDGTLWVNEKLSVEKYNGFTSKGFGLSKSIIDSFITALKNAIDKEEFEKIIDLSNELKLVIHTPDPATVDVRYYKVTEDYVGYTKKGIRLVKQNAAKLLDELIRIKERNIL